MSGSNLRLTTARLLVLVMMIIGAAWFIEASGQPSAEAIAPGRREVVFWHKWGGRERAVVDRIVERFNQSQDEHFVRAIVMPGNNLDLKFFLSVAGGDPPDLLNQDQPVIADWASRGTLVPIDALASGEQTERLNDWLYPAARRIGSYDGRLYGLCNGLDVRALYYNKRLLREHGLSPPQTIAELDSLAERIAPARKNNVRLEKVGFLPDPRRLWAWGIVFGGQFYDQETGKVTVDSPEIIAALRWMTSYSERYGSRQVNEFRAGDQSLAGKAFPLFEDRYAAIMDGQWRVRDMREARDRAREDHEPVPEYGIVPLPAPPGGRQNAGWVNGNFFCGASWLQESRGSLGVYEILERIRRE